MQREVGKKRTFDPRHSHLLDLLVRLRMCCLASMSYFSDFRMYELIIANSNKAMKTNNMQAEEFLLCLNQSKLTAVPKVDRLRIAYLRETKTQAVSLENEARKNSKRKKEKKKSVSFDKPAW